MLRQRLLHVAQCRYHQGKRVYRRILYTCRSLLQEAFPPLAVSTLGVCSLDQWSVIHTGVVPLQEFWNQSLVDYWKEKRISIVDESTLCCYLRSVLENDQSTEWEARKNLNTIRNSIWFQDYRIHRSVRSAAIPIAGRGLDPLLQEHFCSDECGGLLPWWGRSQPSGYEPFHGRVLNQCNNYLIHSNPLVMSTRSSKCPSQILSDIFITPTCQAYADFLMPGVYLEC